MEHTITVTLTQDDAHYLVGCLQEAPAEDDDATRIQGILLDELQKLPND